MKGLKDLSLQAKLVGLSVVTIAALAMLTGVSLMSTRTQLIEDRKEKILNLVEVAHATAAHFEREVREGRLDRAEGMRAAAAAIGAMRYDSVEYFWINDLGRPAPTMIMHPTAPSLNGVVLDATRFNRATSRQAGLSGAQTPLADSNIFVAFVDVVVEAGQGYVEYQWPRPLAGGGVSEALFPKLSYVTHFEPWDWVIGSGIYVDDVDALFRQQATRFLAWGAGLGGLIALALFLVGRNILHTLGGDPLYAAGITRKITQGDLTTEIKCSSGDGASLLAGMGEMQATLRNMIGEIVSGAEHLAQASDELLHASEDVARRSGRQSESASAMAAAVEQMTVSIDQVSHNAGEAHAISQASGADSERGTEIIQNAAAEMRKIADAVQTSSAVIVELGEKSDHITSIVKTIREIADQTNLLALNAAIEAARAGEQGRGFAVVADEVRKLAERTSISTTEIAAMVDKIQSGARNAVASMQAGVDQATRGVSLANKAGESILHIREGALRVVSVVNDISLSIREQSAASNDIARNIEHIAQMSEDSADAVRHTTEAARNLQDLSASLHHSVSRFKIR